MQLNRRHSSRLIFRPFPVKTGAAPITTSVIPCIRLINKAFHWVLIKENDRSTMGPCRTTVLRGLNEQLLVDTRETVSASWFSTA